MPGYVYIMASKKVGTLYIGVTSDLAKRIGEHRQNLIPGFSSDYHVHMLVYYEIHEHIETAIKREKQMKKWERAWKIQMIEKTNPFWDDLFTKIAC